MLSVVPGRFAAVPLLSAQPTTVVNKAATAAAFI
jgi:hypothetical protein